MHSLFIRIIRLLNTLKAQVFNSLFYKYFTATEHDFNPSKSGLRLVPPFIFHEELT